MMRPDMVYQYPIWLVGLSLTAIAVIGTILLEFVIRHLVPHAVRQQHNEIAAAIFSIIGVPTRYCWPLLRCLPGKASTRPKRRVTWRRPN